MYSEEFPKDKCLYGGSKGCIKDIILMIESYVSLLKQFTIQQGWTIMFHQSIQINNIAQ